MEIEQGLPVYTADGRKVGNIDRVVLDPKTHAIAGLVVSRQFFFTEDKALPMNTETTAKPDAAFIPSEVAENRPNETIV